MLKNINNIMIQAKIIITNFKISLSCVTKKKFNNNNKNGSILV